MNHHVRDFGLIGDTFGAIGAILKVTWIEEENPTTSSEAFFILTAAHVLFGKLNIHTGHE